MLYAYCDGHVRVCALEEREVEIKQGSTECLCSGKLRGTPCGCLRWKLMSSV